MTKQEAQERNHKIMRLKGALPNLQSLVPEDIVDKMVPRDLKIFYNVADRLLECIKDTKVKKFTCKNCSNCYDLHKTINKNAYECDICCKRYPELWCIK